MRIKIKYHNEDNPHIHKTEEGDWLDLYTAEEVTLDQFDYKAIPLGVSIQLPQGFEGHLAPRSSTYKHWGVIQTNSIGIIDNSYCSDKDQWHMPVLRLAKGKVTIPKGTRLCQFKVVANMPKLQLEVVEHLDNEIRGGFGSSGR
ncbi:MAG: deoxyuridine 5'-triphosphate nucleotidohydrolase [Planctomycetes bacterium]|nr:deoxyuridine 5'-triphosphate nucleotidohydrolase [Planctomycetota bacterium]